jgi:glycerol-3-phosphate O-acyltransferase
VSYLDKLSACSSEGLISKETGDTLRDFYRSYLDAIREKGISEDSVNPVFEQFLDRVIEQIEHPYSFPPFHERIKKPFDYYSFGLNLLRPLVDFPHSRVVRLDIVDRMIDQLQQGHNVILLANHQTEPDPQAISLLLENTHPTFAEKMIFVAGHRVITDPLAIPFSMGRNLLCIYSKKHIDHPPELKADKLLHNQRTLKRMEELLAAGGKCIYVAPSGGRDRPNAAGDIDVAPFDPQSIEMFCLIAQKAKTPTHFYPLALSTYHLLPPPNSLKKELGEQRQAKCAPIRMAFNDEITMDTFPGSEHVDKKQKRLLRAEYIWNIVKDDYQALIN